MNLHGNRNRRNRSPRRAISHCRLVLQCAIGPLAIIVPCLLADPVIATEYYFSGSGNDQTGNGTQISPWRTITKFNTLDLEPGDKAFFRAGDTFVGSLMLDQSDSGTNATGELNCANQHWFLRRRGTRSSDHSLASDCRSACCT